MGHSRWHTQDHRPGVARHFRPISRQMRFHMFKDGGQEDRMQDTSSVVAWQKLHSNQGNFPQQQRGLA